MQFGGRNGAADHGHGVDTPWKYVLWAAGLGLDLGLVLLRGNAIDDEKVAEIQQRFDQGSSRKAGVARVPNSARGPRRTRSGSDTGRV